jgi:hypothetical protein
MAEKAPRNEHSQYDTSIQDYADAVSWERNPLAGQRQVEVAS